MLQNEILDQQQYISLKTRVKEQIITSRDVISLQKQKIQDLIDQAITQDKKTKLKPSLTIPTSTRPHTSAARISNIPPRQSDPYDERNRAHVLYPDRAFSKKPNVIAISNRNQFWKGPSETIIRKATPQTTQEPALREFSPYWKFLKRNSNVSIRYYVFDARLDIPLNFFSSKTKELSFIKILNNLLQTRFRQKFILVDNQKKNDIQITTHLRSSSVLVKYGHSLDRQFPLQQLLFTFHVPININVEEAREEMREVLSDLYEQCVINDVVHSDYLSLLENTWQNVQTRQMHLYYREEALHPHMKLDKLISFNDQLYAGELYFVIDDRDDQPYWQ